MRRQGRRCQLLALLVVACGSERSGGNPSATATKSSPESVRPDPGIGTVLFVGTSLTAGYGLSADEAFPARIQAKIDSAGLPFRAVNAGLSGETSAGALRRIDWLLEQGPVAVLMIETGANDGLRGQAPDSLRANLRTLLERVRAAQPQARLIVAGMQALPNMGRRYGEQFREVFPEVAGEFDATYLPFLLDGVAGNELLNQPDGVHPTSAGAAIVAANVWHVLRPVLESVATER